MKLNINISKDKIKTTIYFLVVFIFLFFVWQIFVPRSLLSNHTITYLAKSGQGDDEIAKDLEKQGIIKSNYFFRFYVVFSFQHSKLQAGKYLLSSNMSVFEIVQKMVRGDVVKQKVTILEGWDIYDINKYFQENYVLNNEDFLELVKQDFSDRFEFLMEKPKDVSLEGYLFPDTYEVYQGESGQEVIRSILANFDKKIKLEIREEIKKQKKTLFEIVTVASIIEKEVKLMNDKKTVSGIIWKRLKMDMPLQMDSTINYITGKNHPGALIKDTKIDSPYNTYKYKGLPKGPISNPGIDSIMAAIYPKESPYLYYRSLRSGKVIFSRTLAEHIAARGY